MSQNILCFKEFSKSRANLIKRIHKIFTGEMRRIYRKFFRLIKLVKVLSVSENVYLREHPFYEYGIHNILSFQFLNIQSEDYEHTKFM